MTVVTEQKDSYLSDLVDDMELTSLEIKEEILKVIPEGSKAEDLSDDQWSFILHFKERYCNTDYEYYDKMVERSGSDIEKKYISLIEREGTGVDNYQINLLKRLLPGFEVRDDRGRVCKETGQLSFYLTVDEDAEGWSINKEEIKKSFGFLKSHLKEMMFDGQAEGPRGIEFKLYFISDIYFLFFFKKDESFLLDQAESVKSIDALLDWINDVIKRREEEIEETGVFSGGIL